MQEMMFTDGCFSASYQTYSIILDRNYAPQHLSYKQKKSNETPKLLCAASRQKTMQSAHFGTDTHMLMSAESSSNIAHSFHFDGRFHAQKLVSVAVAAVLLISGPVFAASETKIVPDVRSPLL